MTIKSLFWHCASCGNREPAQPEYEHGDSEPCVHCPGTASVVCLAEENKAERHVLRRAAEKTPSNRDAAVELASERRVSIGAIESALDAAERRGKIEALEWVAQSQSILDDSELQRAIARLRAEEGK